MFHPGIDYRTHVQEEWPLAWIVEAAVVLAAQGPGLQPRRVMMFVREALVMMDLQVEPALLHAVAKRVLDSVRPEALEDSDDPRGSAEALSSASFGAFLDRWVQMRDTWELRVCHELWEEEEAQREEPSAGD